MRLDLIFWLVVVIVIPGLIALLFIRAPEKITRWQGKFYRFWYKDYLGMSDEAIDKLPYLPVDRYLMGKMSSFIDEAQTHPENYTGLSRISRGIGCFITAMVLLTIALMVWAILTGRLFIGS